MYYSCNEAHSSKPKFIYPSIAFPMDGLFHLHYLQDDSLNMLTPFLTFINYNNAFFQVLIFGIF